MTAAEEIIADLNCLYSWGRKWNIDFEPAKCYSLCVSRSVIFYNERYQMLICVRNILSACSCCVMLCLRLDLAFSFFVYLYVCCVLLCSLPWKNGIADWLEI